MMPGRLPPELSPEHLLGAYARGYFPMATGTRGGIRWFSPDPRAIIPLESFRMPRSARRLAASGTFELRSDTAFVRVLRGCAAREDTWISAEIMEAYTGLHRLGHAHSVECWQGGDLAGGLYGVALGGAFFGESMFSVVSGASKVALGALVDRLRRGGFRLLDTQWVTPHLALFGAREIPRSEYLGLLAGALQVQGEWTTGITG